MWFNLVLIICRYFLGSWHRSGWPYSTQNLRPSEHVISKCSDQVGNIWRTSTSSKFQISKTSEKARRNFNFTELEDFSISWKMESSAGNLTLLVKNINISPLPGPCNVEVDVQELLIVKYRSQPHSIRSRCYEQIYFIFVSIWIWIYSIFVLCKIFIYEYIRILIWSRIWYSCYTEVWSLYGELEG